MNALPRPQPANGGALSTGRARRPAPMPRKSPADRSLLLLTGPAPGG